MGTSLAELLRGGDVDAFAGFRDAHVGAVRAYAVAACDSHLVESVIDGAFVDFLGRLHTMPSAAPDLEEVLLKATRSASAPRFANTPTVACRAAAELLAAHTNGEAAWDDAALRRHAEQCPDCATLQERAVDAERHYEAALGMPEK